MANPQGQPLVSIRRAVCIATAGERGRAARRAKQQAQGNFVKRSHQLDPSERHARRVGDLISLLEEYGELA